MGFDNKEEKGRPIDILDEGVSIASNVGSIDFEGAGVTGAVIGSDVTETVSGSAADEALRQNFAFAQLTRFNELIYSAGDLTTINIWDDNTKALKLYQKDFVYAGGDLSTITVTRTSDSASFVKTFSYSAGDLVGVDTV